MTPFQNAYLFFILINGYLKNDCYSERRSCVSDQQPQCLYLKVVSFLISYHYVFKQLLEAKLRLLVGDTTAACRDRLSLLSSEADKSANYSRYTIHGFVPCAI